jgi:hypothetical protein
VARIRSVKPALRTSQVVASWPREVRYFFVLLWGYLDDEGRGLDVPKTIAGDCFPHDDDVTPAKVGRWLDLMATTKTGPDKEPPICRYEIAGRRLIHCVNWDEHQRPNRPTPSVLPHCPVHEPLSESGSESLTESGLVGGPMDGPEFGDESPAGASKSRGGSTEKRSRKGNETVLRPESRLVVAPLPMKPGSDFERSQQSRASPSSESPVSPQVLEVDSRKLTAGEVDSRGSRLTEPPTGAAASGLSPEPPPRCPKHLNNPEPPPCGACAEARKLRTRWETQRAARQAAAPKCRSHRGQPADNCALCRSETLAPPDAEEPA